jgi:hypothetical protein
MLRNHCASAAAEHRYAAARRRFTMSPFSTEAQLPLSYLLLPYPVLPSSLTPHGRHLISLSAVFPSAANLGRQRHTRPHRQSRSCHRCMSSEKIAARVLNSVGGNAGVGKETVKVR